MTPPVPASWLAPMPSDALARLIAGVRSFFDAHADAESVERFREAAEPEPMCCARCGVVLTDEARCWNCGRHTEVAQ